MRYEFMARGVRARELLITTANECFVLSQKEKKRSDLSLSLLCFLFSSFSQSE